MDKKRIEISFKKAIIMIFYPKVTNTQSLLMTKMVQIYKIHLYFRIQRVEIYQTILLSTIQLVIEFEKTSIKQKLFIFEILNFKKEKVKLKRPVRPSNSFGLYLKSLDRGDASVIEFMKGAALKWNALAQQDKEVFINEAKANNEKYNEELKHWEIKMINDGHEKLVRRGFSNSLNKSLISKNKLDDKKAKKILEKIDASKKKANKLIRKAKTEQLVAKKLKNMFVKKSQKAKIKVNNLLEKIKNDLTLKNTKKTQKVVKSKSDNEPTRSSTTSADNSSDSSSSSESESEAPKSPPSVKKV